MTFRTVVDLNTVFLSLVQVTDDMGLKVNKGKTNSMVTGKSAISSSIISVGCHNFQKVESIIYFATMVNCDNDVTMRDRGKN
jgi:hypothetical protein